MNLINTIFFLPQIIAQTCLLKLGRTHPPRKRASPRPDRYSRVLVPLRTGRTFKRRERYKPYNSNTLSSSLPPCLVGGILDLVKFKIASSLGPSQVRSGSVPRTELASGPAQTTPAPETEAKRNTTAPIGRLVCASVPDERTASHSPPRGRFLAVMTIWSLRGLLALC